jgi:hypothetical protein
MAAILANAGVPMLFWQLPVAAVALVPIVVVESLIAWPMLGKRFSAVAGRVFAANAISTFFGIPLAWIGMVIVNLAIAGGTAHGFGTPLAAFKSVVLQAAWLIPYEDQLRWLVPAATLVLLVPYFFVSVFVERWWLKRRFTDVATTRVAAAAWVGNLVTYGAFAVYTVLWLRRALPGQPAAG